MRDLAEDFGNSGKILGWYRGPRPVIYSTNPDFLKEVFIKESETYIDRPMLDQSDNVPHLIMLKGDLSKIELKMQSLCRKIGLKKSVEIMLLHIKNCLPNQTNLLKNIKCVANNILSVGNHKCQHVDWGPMLVVIPGCRFWLQLYCGCCH